MKKLIYLIVLALILGLVLTGCLLSNIGQSPTSEQSGITYLTKSGSPPDDLVALWHLDEGTRTFAYDSSGNNNNGTIIGATYVGSTNAMFGNALSFNGEDDYVELPPSNTILNNNTFTIEAWFKTSVNHPVYGSLDGIGEGRIVNLARDTAGYTAVALYVEQDNIAICYHNGAGFKHLKYTVDYHDDIWHHIAVTRDSTTYKLYYDGVEVASRADTFVGFGTSAAYLGTFYPTTTIDPIKRFFNGTIDEVRIWNTALTPGTIEERIYGFNGLMASYAPPGEKAFKAGRTIPLKWQYTDFYGNVVDSFGADPVVEYQFVGNGNCGGLLEETEAPGSSGLHYDTTSGIWQWQFNWQTKDLYLGTGIYKILITSVQTGQVNGPFLIELR